MAATKPSLGNRRRSAVLPLPVRRETIQCKEDGQSLEGDLAAEDRNQHEIAEEKPKQTSEGVDAEKKSHAATSVLRGYTGREHAGKDTRKQHGDRDDEKTANSDERNLANEEPGREQAQRTEEKRRPCVERN